MTKDSADDLWRPCLTPVFYLAPISSAFRAETVCNMGAAGEEERANMNKTTKTDNHSISWNEMWLDSRIESQTNGKKIIKLTEGVAQ